jgi:TRAP-type uncharacterized transport system fused permease subunit
MEVSQIIFLAFVAIAALAAGLQGWLLKKANLLERCVLVAAGVLVIIPAGNLDYVGLGLFALAFVLQVSRRTKAPAPA